MRCGAGLLAEEAGKVGGIGEGKIVGDLVDRFAGEDELALRFGEHAVADQVTGGDAGCALDVIVETVDGHGKLVGVEGKLPLLLEMLLDQFAQGLDGRAGGFEHERGGARPPGREPRHFNRDQRQQPAHGDAEAGAGKERFLVELSGQF